MGLFDDVARFGSKVAGDIGAGVITGSQVITGQVSPFKAPNAFQEQRRISQAVSGILTNEGLKEFDEPKYVPKPIIDAARVPRGAVNLGGSALDLAGTTADSAAALGGAVEKLADLNRTTGGFALPVIVGGAAYLILKD